MNYSQANSVFQPGLTRRGPVYNANLNLGALPAFPPSGIKLALMAAALAAGFFKKIPLPLAAAGAGAVWFLIPDTSAGAAANAAAPAMALPAIPSPVLDMSQVPLPTIVPVAQ